MKQKKGSNRKYNFKKLNICEYTDQGMYPGYVIRMFGGNEALPQQLFGYNTIGFFVHTKLDKELFRTDAAMLLKMGEKRGWELSIAGDVVVAAKKQLNNENIINLFSQDGDDDEFETLVTGEDINRSASRLIADFKQKSSCVMDLDNSYGTYSQISCNQGLIDSSEITGKNGIIPAFISHYPYADNSGETAIVFAQEKADYYPPTRDEDGRFEYTPGHASPKCLVGSTLFNEGLNVLTSMTSLTDGWYKNDAVQSVFVVSGKGSSKYGGNDNKPFVNIAADVNIMPSTPTVDNLSWDTSFNVNTQCCVKLPRAKSFKVMPYTEYNYNNFLVGNIPNNDEDSLISVEYSDENGFWDFISKVGTYLKKGVKVALDVAGNVVPVLKTVSEAIGNEERPTLIVEGDLKLLPSNNFIPNVNLTANNFSNKIIEESGTKWCVTPYTINNGIINENDNLIELSYESNGFWDFISKAKTLLKKGLEVAVDIGTKAAPIVKTVIEKLGNEDRGTLLIEGDLKLLPSPNFIPNVNLTANNFSNKIIEEPGTKWSITPYTITNGIINENDNLIELSYESNGFWDFISKAKTLLKKGLEVAVDIGTKAAPIVKTVIEKLGNEERGTLLIEGDLKLLPSLNFIPNVDLTANSISNKVIQSDGIKWSIGSYTINNINDNNNLIELSYNNNEWKASNKIISQFEKGLNVVNKVEETYHSILEVINQGNAIPSINMAGNIRIARTTIANGGELPTTTVIDGVAYYTYNTSSEEDAEIANHAYVLAHSGSGENVLHKSENETVTGIKTFNVLPVSDLLATANNQFVTKGYVDSKVPQLNTDTDQRISGTGQWVFNGVPILYNAIVNELKPNQLVTKSYVDDSINSVKEDIVHPSSDDDQLISGLGKWIFKLVPALFKKDDSLTSYFAKLTWEGIKWFMGNESTPTYRGSLIIDNGVLRLSSNNVSVALDGINNTIKLSHLPQLLSEIEPTDNKDLATKKYVDSKIVTGNYLKLHSDTVQNVTGAAIDWGVVSHRYNSADGKYTNNIYYNNTYDKYGFYFTSSYHPDAEGESEKFARLRLMGEGERIILANSANQSVEINNTSIKMSTAPIITGATMVTDDMLVTKSYVDSVITDDYLKLNSETPQIINGVEITYKNSLNSFEKYPVCADTSEPTEFNLIPWGYAEGRYLRSKADSVQIECPKIYYRSGTELIFTDHLPSEEDKKDAVISYVPSTSTNPCELALSARDNKDTTAQTTVSLTPNDFRVFSHGDGNQIDLAVPGSGLNLYNRILLGQDLMFFGLGSIDQGDKLNTPAKEYIVMTEVEDIHQIGMSSNPVIVNESNNITDNMLITKKYVDNNTIHPTFSAGVDKYGNSYEQAEISFSFFDKRPFSFIMRRTKNRNNYKDSLMVREVNGVTSTITEGEWINA